MRQTIAFFLIFITLFSAIPETVYATASTDTPNYTINGFTYTVDAKTQTATIVKYTGSDTSVTIPENLGGYPVTRVGSEAFARCSALETVTLPDSVESIGREAFSDCTSLSSINFPMNWTTAGALQEGYIFRGCTKLTSIVVPEGVEAIPAYAFQGWSSLEEITLPSTLKEIKMNAFQSCVGLTHIDFPDSVTTIGQRSFANCNSLTNLTFPASLEKVSNNAFNGCDNLISVDIPENTTKISNNAFSDCPNLRHVYIDNKDCTLDGNVFKDSDNVTIICPINSLATTYAIDNELAFSADHSAADTAGEVLQRQNCLYQADANSIYTNGYITLSLNYSVNEEDWGTIRNPKIVLKVPAGTELVESTLTVDDTLCTEYDYDEDESTVTIKISERSGHIKFSVRALELRDIRSYAILRYGRNGEAVYEVIGIVEESMSHLSLYAEEVTPSTEILVEGLAPAQTDVELYVDGERIDTVTSNKAGNYQAQISFHTLKDTDVFTLEARSVAENGEVLSVSREVTYMKGAPKLLDFHFYFNSNRDKYIDLYDYREQGIRPVITANNIENPMRFVVVVDNASEIETLYITSTRNNVKYSMVAEYDKATDSFVAEGFFNPANEKYLPGVIGVEYNLKRNETLVSTREYDVDWQFLTDCLSEEVVNNVKVSAAPTDMGSAGTIDFSGVSEDLANVVLNYSIASYDDKNGTSINDMMSLAGKVEKMYSYIVPGVDDSKYFMSLDFSDAETFSMVVADMTDIANTAVELKLSAEHHDYLYNGGSYPFKLEELASELSLFSTAAELISKTQHIENDYDALCKEIMMSAQFDDTIGYKRKVALEKATELRNDQMILTLLSTALPLIVASGPMSGPTLLFTAMVAGITSLSDLFYQQRLADIRGETFNIKWVIDPSGYVYDITTEERLEGVTATVYCIEYDDSDTFWDNVPAKDQYGTKWNALEYSQQNPLTTNEEGRYAWDVPEGWWRVKYEKEGYETTWSEWLPVPPPQTEVNIGMTPLHTAEESATEEPASEEPATEELVPEAPTAEPEGESEVQNESPINLWLIVGIVAVIVVAAVVLLAVKKKKYRDCD